MPVKLTMFFEAPQGPRTVGWSENYYLSYPDLQSASTELTGPTNFVALRVQMLGINIENIANRLTLVTPGVPPVNPPRRNVLLAPGYFGFTSSLGIFVYNKLLATYTGDFVQTVWMLRVSTAVGGPNLYTRTLWVRGLPDLAQETDVPQPIAGAWQSAITAWTTYLTSSGRLMIQSDDRSGANPVKACTAYNGTTNQYTVPAHGFSNGQVITAIGWRGTVGSHLPRGNYKCGVIDANTIVLIGAGVIGMVTTLGGFRALSYVYNPVASFAGRGFTNKKVGRPFGQLAGRKRVPTRPRA